MTRRVHGVGVDHPAVASALGNLSHALRSAGDMEGSSRAYLESMEMMRRLHAGMGV
jgi:hypothetical protein